MKTHGSDEVRGQPTATGAQRTLSSTRRRGVKPHPSIPGHIRYLRENTVGYLKSPCGAADVQAPFFLHVVPENEEDLPADRRQYGFDNLDFHYGGGAALAFGGMCIAKRPLPDYPIARISTGQFTPDDGKIWKAEFPVGAVGGEAAARSAPGRAPGR